MPAVIPPLDLTADPIELTAALVDIPSVSRAEAEIADADKDFRKEMAEKGIRIPAGRVMVETEVSMVSPR